MRRFLLLSGIIALVFCAGYYFGRRSVHIMEKTVVAYRDLPSVKVTIHPEAFRFSIPALPEWIWLTDTLTLTSVIDTAAILADWILQRDYSGRLIEDSTAVIDYSAAVQYNRLQWLSVDYHPRQRTVTTTKVVKQNFIPFLLLGANSAGHGQIEGGIFTGRWGFSLELSADFKGNYHYGGKIGWRPL